MCHENFEIHWKFRENRVGINMKASFQMLTVNVMVWLLGLTVANKKHKKIGKHI